MVGGCRGRRRRWNRWRHYRQGNSANILFSPWRSGPSRKGGSWGYVENAAGVTPGCNRRNGSVGLCHGGAIGRARTGQIYRPAFSSWRRRCRCLMRRSVRLAIGFISYSNAVYDAFDGHLVRQRREFFQFDPERIRSPLSLIGGMRVGRTFRGSLILCPLLVKRRHQVNGGMKGACGFSPTALHYIRGAISSSLRQKHSRFHRS